MTKIKTRSLTALRASRAKLVQENLHILESKSIIQEDFTIYAAENIGVGVPFDPKQIFEDLYGVSIETVKKWNTNQGIDLTNILSSLDNECLILEKVTANSPLFVLTRKGKEEYFTIKQRWVTFVLETQERRKRELRLRRFKWIINVGHKIKKLLVFLWKHIFGVIITGVIIGVLVLIVWSKIDRYFSSIPQ